MEMCLVLKAGYYESEILSVEVESQSKTCLQPKCPTCCHSELKDVL